MFCNNKIINKHFFVLLIFYIYLIATPTTKAVSLDKIYIINLKHNKDRLDKISHDLGKQKIKFERFNAILGLDIKIADQKGNIFYGKDIAERKVKFALNKTYKIYCPNITLNYTYHVMEVFRDTALSPGELGCICSHYEIMLDVIKNKYKFAIIFEDDTIIPYNFSKIVLDMGKNLPPSYDYIMLGTSNATILSDKKAISLKFKDISNNKIFQSITSYPVKLYGTYAMVYSYEGAIKIVKNIDIDYPIDDTIASLITQNKLNSYRLKDYNFIVDYSFESEIHKMMPREYKAI